MILLRIFNGKIERVRVKERVRFRVRLRNILRIRQHKNLNFVWIKISIFILTCWKLINFISPTDK